MKVLLINPPNKEILVSRDMAGGLGFDRNETMLLSPLDLAYIASTLLQKGHSVKIIDAAAENFGLEQTYTKMKKYNPEVVISLVSLPSINEDCRFLKNIDRYIKVKKIAKTSITYPPIIKEIINKSKINFCICGECETIINEILEGKEKKSTAYFDKNGQFKIEEKYTIKDLNKLPIPARNLLPNKQYHYPLLGKKTTTMQTSRGCPFPCAYYCPYPLVQGRKWRARSPENVIEEIKNVVLNHNINRIFFRDATFTLDKKRTIKICDLIIANKLKIEWWCESRINCLDAELLKKMKKSGCKGINVGIETGDPKILEEQAKIGVNIKKIKNIVKNSRKIGIKLHFLIMVGLPSETKKSLYKTFKLLEKIKPWSMGITIVTPYPGTPLFEEAQKRGWIKKTVDWSKFGGHFSIMKTDNLSVSEINKGRKMISRGYCLTKSCSLESFLKLQILKFYFKIWSLLG